MQKKWKPVVLAMIIVIMIGGNCWAGVAGKKVLFVDSYHEGYAWSDGIKAGIQRTLNGKGLTLKAIHMDTKRHSGEAFKQEAAQKAKSEIESFRPDVVIAADDNASKYLVAAYYKDADLPFVFCGVNWDATTYGYPYANATGMVEVTPVPQLIEQLQKTAKGDRIGFLGPDTLTAHKELENYQKVFKINPVAHFATSYEDWKKGFRDLQNKADILLIDSDGGLYKDHESDMRAFVESNTKIPTGSCYDFMAVYSILTFAKSAEEQGDWAAGAALKILNGVSPKDIPIVQNKEGSLIVNARIASNSNTDLPYELIESAKKVIE
jgi:ABC-type uncharacterized transport system substrate-binding protein